MTLGDNRRTFLSALLLGGGSVMAFGQSFRHSTPVGGSADGDALFEYSQAQLAAALRTARGRGGYVRAEDAAAAAYVRTRHHAGRSRRDAGPSEDGKRQSLGPLNAPTSVELWQTLPRTSVGKIDKQRIRQQYWSHAERAIN